MKNQKGMTLIGMLLTMILVAFFLYVVIRVFPVYMNYYSITQSVKALNSIPSSDLTGDPFQDGATLRRAVNKRLEINGINDLKDDELVVRPKSEGKYLINLKYKVIKPLFYNVSLMFDFEDAREVSPSGGN